MIGAYIEVNTVLSDKIKLTAKDILEKEFKTGMRGYRPEDVYQQAAPGTTNFDILKRLSNLEKHVFGSKLYE